MTPEEHNKYIAYSNIAYGALMSLLGLLMMIFFVGVLGTVPNGPPLGMMLFFTLMITGIYGVMTIPSFIAAWGLLKRKKWARTASIIAAVVAASNFPIGTAVCVYTFWFLFSDPGKVFFDQILKDTQQGFFADPIYGGNKDMVAWKMIGYPGARYNYLDWIDRHNERFPLPPVGIAGSINWTPKS